MHASLADLPLLNQLTEEQRSIIIEAGFEKTLERGEVLFHENDPAEALYAVVSGQLKSAASSSWSVTRQKAGSFCSTW
jgi:CRP-like cAMP-binding protein